MFKPHPRRPARRDPSTERRPARSRVGAPSIEAADTRRRLLEAAGEVFAERGFRSATVREICSRAGANIAGVNYHFHDKSSLYSEALRHAHHCAIERHPPTLDTTPGDPPERRLEAFVTSFLRRVLDEGRPAWHGRLMCREMNEPSPTPALDDLVRDQIQGHFTALVGILREIAPMTGDERLRLSAMSTVAQCLHFRFARPVIDRMFPGRYGHAEIALLANHITSFTTAALRGMPPAPSAPPATKRSARSGGRRS